MRSRRCAACSMSPAMWAEPTCGWRARTGSTRGAVSAMGWAERVRREDVAAFELRARAEGAAGYRVFDRSDGALGARPSARRPSIPARSSPCATSSRSSATPPRSASTACRFRRRGRRSSRRSTTAVRRRPRAFV